MSLFFSSRRRHTRFDCDWSSDVCSSDLGGDGGGGRHQRGGPDLVDGRSPGGRTRAQAQGGAGGDPAGGGPAGARSEERRVGKESTSGVLIVLYQQQDTDWKELDRGITIL